MYAVIWVYSYRRRSPGWSAGRLEWRFHRWPHRRIRWWSISRFGCGFVWRGRTGRVGRFNCRSCRFCSGLAAGHLMNMYTKCLYEIIFMYECTCTYKYNTCLFMHTLNMVGACCFVSDLRWSGRGVRCRATAGTKGETWLCCWFLSSRSSCPLDYKWGRMASLRLSGLPTFRLFGNGVIG